MFIMWSWSYNTDLQFLCIINNKPINKLGSKQVEKKLLELKTNQFSREVSYKILTNKQGVPALPVAMTSGYERVVATWWLYESFFFDLIYWVLFYKLFKATYKIKHNIRLVRRCIHIDI